MSARKDKCASSRPIRASLLRGSEPQQPALLGSSTPFHPVISNSTHAMVQGEAQEYILNLLLAGRTVHRKVTSHLTALSLVLAERQGVPASTLLGSISSPSSLPPLPTCSSHLAYTTGTINYISSSNHPDIRHEIFLDLALICIRKSLTATSMYGRQFSTRTRQYSSHPPLPQCRAHWPR